MGRYGRSIVGAVAMVGGMLGARVARADGDVVLLKDGTQLQGTVVRQEPGKFVVIRKADGREVTLAWDDVKRVEAGTSTSSVDAGGAKGLGVGIAGERVTKLKAPTDRYYQIAIDGGFLYGKSTKSDANVSIYGGGANFNFQYRVGGQLPGIEGGSWSGFGVDATLGVFGAGEVIKIDTATTGAGFLMINGGGSVGYQYLTFGGMNEETLKQHGFGVFVGGKAGVANTQVFASGATESTTSPQYGPQIQLTFPEYNFGTAQRAAFYLSAYVLPTGDFIFANIQAGGSFN